MPIDYRRYPPNWREISQRVRDRAGQRCEWEGCGAPNGARIVREPGNPEAYRIVPSSRDGDTPVLDDERAIRVVLTVAHLDHDPSSADESRLRAWCQLHHLRYDATLHGRNAAETRRRKREAAGQLAMVVQS